MQNNISPTEQIDLSQLKTESLFDRPSKVKVSDLGKICQPNQSIAEFLQSLPNQFAACELHRLAELIVNCYQNKRIIAAAIGGHVIKVGTAPYLIDLIERGFLQSISMNGSAAIHDWELAVSGKTSEDVASQLKLGLFGMAKETADGFADAARWGTESARGLGFALGKQIEENKNPWANSSLLAAAYRHKIPCTVHVALGTDIVHMHPQVSGAILGEASLIDFRILCQVVKNMQHGLWLNIGSAVVMPEVFLKAIAIAKNLGADLSDLITANLDKESKYRTRMNVLSRPSAVGIEIIGHHEINIPLLHANILAKWQNSSLPK